MSRGKKNVKEMLETSKQDRHEEDAARSGRDREFLVQRIRFLGEEVDVRFCRVTAASE